MSKPLKQHQKYLKTFESRQHQRKIVCFYCKKPISTGGLRGKKGHIHSTCFRKYEDEQAKTGTILHS